MDKAELQSGLAQCYGTMEKTQWSGLFRNHLLTDGAKFLAEHAGGGAYWLMDAVASYHADCMKDAMLREMQIWHLIVNRGEECEAITLCPSFSLDKLVVGSRETVIPNGGALLICERDTNDVAFCQVYLHTDFPLDEIKLYAMNDGQHITIMLPSEY